MEIKEPYVVKHFTNVGDLVASMCAVKRIYDKTGRKVRVLQQTGVRAQYYHGATHPVLDEAGEYVCQNDKIWEMIKPLILSQEYIDSADKYIGQKINIDLDVIRGDQKFVNLPHGSIQSWLMYAYPDLAADISKPWIFLNEECPEKILKQVNGKVLLNFTERYRNGVVNYFFLKKYENNLIFCGTPREHLLFSNTWGLDIPLLEAENFLEIAYAIKYAKFLLSCQSVGWNIAEAIKSPRILEVCRFAQNCLSFYGEHSYGFFHQEGLEYYFDLLY